MYEAILLPLDGSELSERAIPHAAAVARRFDSRLVVLRVVVPIIGPGDLAYGPNPYTYQSLLEAETRAAQEYVARKAEELRAQGLRAEGVCRTGEPATSIVDFAAESDAKLVVIATHGRSGVARWVFGSVATRVLQGAQVPVLLIRAALPQA
ncbi:MAG: universal stress protein [Acidobacteriota bacterium]